MPTKRPNIVFILIDDMGWRDLGCYGSEFYETPNIDRLAAEGMQFSDAYAACPVCSPTRASIMTGKYPARLGITNYIPGDDCGKLAAVPYTKHLPLEEVTVARALKEQFDRHKRIARWTWGIWMFVSVSGVVIYLMNYQIWPGRSLAQRAFDAGYAAHRALDDAEALELYRKAEGMGHVGASCLAAVVADRIEKTDTASAAVSAVLARFPDDPHCLVIRGRQHILAGDAKRGRAVLVKAVERLPNDAFAFATLAFAQFRLHEYADAAKSFERSIELDPSMPANIYNAGYAHFLYGNYPKARPLLERALQAGIDAELAERAKRDLGIIDGTLWMCPMHAHVTGDKGDKCGECGMDLEPAARGMGSDTIEDGQ